MASSGKDKTLALTSSRRQSNEILRQLRFFAAKSKEEWDHELLVIPDTEVLLYDSFSPDPYLVARRIRSIYRLLKGDYRIVLIDIACLLRLLAPPSYFKQRGLQLRIGETLDYQKFIEGLIENGYQRRNYVAQPGDMAVRGSIVDLFPPGADLPCRLELLDDKLDSLRTFAVQDQLSVEQVEELNILPPTEFPLDEKGREAFVVRWQNSFVGSARNHPVYLEVKNGGLPAGVESFLPLFFYEEPASFLDYFAGKDYKLFYAEIILDRADSLTKEARERWLTLGGEDAILLKPDDLLMSISKLRESLVAQDNLYKTPSLMLEYDVRIDLTEQDKSQRLVKLAEFRKNYKGKLLLCAQSAKRYRLICDWLLAANLSYSEPKDWDEFHRGTADLGIINAEFHEGMVGDAWGILTEQDLFGNFSSENVEPEDGRTKFYPRDGLVLGELVIHRDYGLGRFLGLENRKEGEQEGEFVVIEYAEESKLYLPVHNMHLLNTYSSVVGSGKDYPLDKLGANNWGKRKGETMRKIEDTAVSLLEIYAEREQHKGINFSPPDKDYEDFTLGFPFEETKSQARAINEVIADMCSDKKMDRLICGDVGFGKTEIVIRAAYLAAASGYQTIVLTPTTLLASQHLETFKSRFAKTPFIVAGLTRFTKGGDKIKDDLARGKIDIIIGTHVLLGSGLKYSRLGLAVIDEEHRFGVRQKEKIKSIHKEVDIVALSATPIPRTLNLALSGVRDISLLIHPPPGRLPIKTYTGVYTEQMVKEAISRELQRDGQVYYVYNKIDFIQGRCDYLAKIFPAAKIAAIHGQMEREDLEEIMHDFYHNRISILVCTTIIENGLDVHNANTIVIEDAERFGLSQLHQLRGRVGRRKRQAFAYILTGNEGAEDNNAFKRIQAVRQNAELGLGFNLATHDLEIRGAGEILGAEQSGFIQRVGVELYTQLLTESVAGKRRKIGDKLRQDPVKAELDLALSAFIPHSYVEDIMERVRIYKRLDNIDVNEKEELEQIRQEMIDVYGPIPLYTANLFELHKLRVKAQSYGITKLRIARLNGFAQAHPDYEATLVAWRKLAEDEPKNYLLVENTLRFKCDNLGGMQQMIRLNNLMSSIQSAISIN